MIYTFECKNLLTNEYFTLTYKDQTKANQFINRCRFSKKIKIISIDQRADLTKWL